MMTKLYLTNTLSLSLFLATIAARTYNNLVFSMGRKNPQKNEIKLNLGDPKDARVGGVSLL